MELSKALHFENSREWHEWLSLNHDKEAEAWAVIQKKSSGQKGLRYEEALDEALCFGWIDGKMKTIDAEKFALRFSPRKAKSVWSRINRDKAEQLIYQGRMTDAGLARVEEAKKNGTWENAYTNKQRDEIPPDLEAALLADRIAWLNFQKFANSYRNMYTGWVVEAKTEITRRRRIEEVVRRASLNKKPGY